MTCREKLAIEYPEDISDYYDGGCKGCPGTYGYLPKPIWCETPCDTSLERYDKCAKCWDREIPEEKSDMQKSITPELDAFRDALKNTPVINFGLSKETFSNTNFKPKYPPHILDSGNRREFETGAVRDIQEGKGRCDLMPLDVVAEHCGKTLEYIYAYQCDGNRCHLVNCLQHFFDKYYDNNIYNGYLEVSKHFEEGAKKYGENNWQKGIPTHCYIDSAVRHYLKYLRGDKDEPHDRAFVWNLLCCIWTCKHKPELNDYGEKDDEKSRRTPSETE